jgi:UDP-N-acetylmuramate--alanine ligase
MNNPAKQKTYFFCGIGGSGMMPLAAILAKKGNRIIGSDRGRDKGDSPDKFKSLEKLGIELLPQDGSGVQGDMLVVSSAVEDSVPDVAAAKSKNIPIKKRAEILADLFNSYKTGISIAGTSVNPLSQA